MAPIAFNNRCDHHEQLAAVCGFTSHDLDLNFRQHSSVHSLLLQVQPMLIFTQRVLFIGLTITLAVLAGIAAGIAHDPPQRNPPPRHDPPQRAGASEPVPDQQEQLPPREDNQPPAATVAPSPANPGEDAAASPNEPPGLKLPQWELPELDPAELEIPELDDPPDPRVLESIHRMLEGSGPVPETSDPILNGLLEHLGNRSSVPKGRMPDPSGQWIPEVSRAAQSRRAVAAELLLKTARKLEQLGSPDPSRQQLVNEMRREAVRVLSE